MKLTSGEIKHIAKLANLPISSQEEEKYSKQLSKILEYVDQLNSVDTSGVEASFNVSGQKNVMAEDKIRACLSHDEAISNASKKQDGSFLTKGVFDE